jgi:hypothetical protein
LQEQFYYLQQNRTQHLFTSSSKYTNELEGKLLEEIINNAIESYHPVFLAFDVVDGNLSIKEYFKKLKEKRK